MLGIFIPAEVRLCLQAMPPLPQLPLDWDKMTVIEIDYRGRSSRSGTLAQLHRGMITF
jgi:hypothetical protein